MKKKLLAIATVASLSGGALAVAPQAQAQPAQPPAGYTEPERAPFHGSSTGSSVLDVTFASVLIGLVVKLVVDNVEPLRAAVDDIAAQLGSSHHAGSSQESRAATGWDFHLPTLPGRLSSLSSGSSL